MEIAVLCHDPQMISVKFCYFERNWMSVEVSCWKRTPNVWASGYAMLLFEIDIFSSIFKIMPHVKPTQSKLSSQNIQ